MERSAILGLGSPREKTFEDGQLPRQSRGKIFLSYRPNFQPNTPFSKIFSQKICIFICTVKKKSLPLQRFPRKYGRLAQLVQSICLTSRGSAVRIRQRPPQEAVSSPKQLFLCAHPRQQSHLYTTKSRKQKRPQTIRAQTITPHFAPAKCQIASFNTASRDDSSTAPVLLQNRKNDNRCK